MNPTRLYLTSLLCTLVMGLSAQTVHEVTVQSNFYDPATLTIAPGDIVTWTNLGGFHNVNGSTDAYPDNPEGFSNGSASSAAWTFEYTFDVPGTYQYQCDPHVGFGMVGTVIVQDNTPVDADLLITAVYDGPLSGGVPKGVELYALNDIPDLSNYGIGSATNGGGTDGEEFTFPAQAVSAGTYLYVSSEVDGFNAFFGFDPDFDDGSMSINGDDAIELFQNGEVIDVFGMIDMDGTGTPWEYADGWAYRVNGTGPDGATFVLSNWIFSGVDALDGATDNSSAATPVPIGTYSPSGTGALTVNNDFAITEINEQVNIDVLANDFVPNPIENIGFTDASNGLVDLNMDNTFTYVPDTDFCGEDSFTYEVCDSEGCQTGTVNITVNCPISYPAYDIGTVTTVDAEGFLDSTGVTAELTGLVYGVNLQGSGSLQFTLIDSNGDGVGVFSPNSDYGYTVQEGDNVTVQGVMDQFNGFTQIRIDTLILNSTGNTIVTPTVVTALSEDTESQLVTLENVMLVDPSQWQGGSPAGFNVEVTDGTNTYELRIDNQVDLFDMPAPTGTFDVTGIGGQFDSNAPFDEGYQLLPRYVEDIDPYNPQSTEYPSYPIGEVTTVDSEGVADSLGALVELTGVVYGINLRNTGYSFTLIDGNNDGIGVFSNNDFDYTVQEGDELTVQGTITQFMGLTQVTADGLMLNSTDNTLFDPTAVTDLNEDTESQLVSVEGTFPNPGQWDNSGGSFNIDFSDGSNTYNIRIDDNTDIAGTDFPGPGLYRITGIGGQFDDNGSPFDEGYQLLPRYQEDIDLLSSTIDPALGELVDIYPNPASHWVRVELAEPVDLIRMDNALGQTIKQVLRPDLVEQLDLGRLSAGIYTLTFVQGNRIWAQQLIIE